MCLRHCPLFTDESMLLEFSIVKWQAARTLPPDIWGMGIGIWVGSLTLCGTLCSLGEGHCVSYELIDSWVKRPFISCVQIDVSDSFYVRPNCLSLSLSLSFLSCLIIPQIQRRAINIHQTLVNIQTRKQIRPIRTNYVDVLSIDIRTHVG